MCIKLFWHKKIKLPLLKVSVEDSAWESLSANSDTFQYTVTSQLVDDQVIVHNTWEYTIGLIIPEINNDIRF